MIFSISCVRVSPPNGIPCERATACNSTSDCSVNGRIFCLRGLRDARDLVTFSCAPPRLREPLRDLLLRDPPLLRDLRDLLGMRSYIDARTAFIFSFYEDFTS